MVDIISWRNSKNFHKENLDIFLRNVSNQADKLQIEQRAAPRYQPGEDTERQHKMGSKRNNQKQTKAQSMSM